MVRAEVDQSPWGHLAMRPGLLASRLLPEDCANMAPSCTLESPAAAADGTSANGAAAFAALDLCSTSGTAGGGQVPGVSDTDAYHLPPGRCFDNADCSGAPGRVCDKQGVTTEVRSCSRGVDLLKTMGACVPTPCQKCKVKRASAVALLAPGPAQRLHVCCRRSA
jgi:hypothetical protein